MLYSKKKLMEKYGNKINKLTNDQVRMLFDYRKSAAAAGNCTQEADWEKADNAIKRLYLFLRHVDDNFRGINPPERNLYESSRFISLNRGLTPLFGNIFPLAI